MAYQRQGFSWSVSRQRLFAHCRRKYYLQYYAHELKRLDKEVWLDTLLCKYLQSYRMWIGSCVHWALALYLHGVVALGPGHSVDARVGLLDAVRRKTLAKMDEEFARSTSRDYSKYDRDNRFGLTEHAYGEMPSDALAQSHDRVEAVLDSFCVSELHDTVIERMDVGWQLFVEPLDADYDLMRFLYSSESLDEPMVVWAQPDFALTSPDGGEVIIYDRKSGQEPDLDALDDRRYLQASGNAFSYQLLLYAHKYCFKAKRALADLKLSCREVYVPSMLTLGGEVLQACMDGLEAFVTTAIGDQLAYLCDEDVQANKPLPIGSFARLPDEAGCASCRFRRVCLGRLKQVEPAVGLWPMDG